MASSAIKGLTVEIGGDTSKLGNALKDVEAKSRGLSRELKDVEKLLKLDPGNATLLAQKQEILAKAVAATSEKLETLKEAERQVQEQFERGEVSEAQVRALQREIIATENQLRGYQRSAEQTADEINRLGDTSELASKDLDQTGDEAKQASKKVDEFAASADKAEKSGGGMGKTLASAAATGLKAVGAACGAAITGLTAATVNAAAYADEMITMSTVTGMSTDDLQAFNYAAGLLDVGVETISKSLAKNTKSMYSAADGSKAYAEAYGKLGVSITDANGNLRDGETVYWEAIDALGQMSNETERDAIAMQLFGKSAQELNPLIEAGSEKVNELKQEAKDVGAVMSGETLAALGAFDDSIQRLKGSAGAAKNSLGGVLLPELQLLTDTGTDLLGEFTKNLNASGGGLDGLASTLSGMAPRIGAAVGDLVKNLAEKAATLAPALVNVALQLVTTLGTSLVSTLPQLVDVIVQVLTEGIPQVIDGAVQLLLAILQALPQVITSLVAALPTLVLSIVNGLTSAIPQLLTGAVQFLCAIIDALPQLIALLVPQIPTIVLAVIDGLLGCIPALLAGAVQLLNAIIDAIPLLIQALVPQIPTIVSAICGALIDALPVLLDAAFALFMAIVKAIPKIVKELIKALPTILKAITGVLKQLPSLIWGIFTQVLAKVGQWIAQMGAKGAEAATKLTNNVVNFIKQLPGKIGTFLTNAVNKVATWGGNMANKARAGMGKLISAVTNTLKSLPTKVKSIGGDLVRGLWNGITDKFSWLVNKIKSFANDVTDRLKKFFGIASPSKVTTWMGEMLDEGLAVGMLDNVGAPVKAMQRVTGSVLGAAQGFNGLSIERGLRTSYAAAQPTAAVPAGLGDKLDAILAAIERGQILTIDGKALIGATATGYDNTLGQRRALAARGAL